MKWVFILIAPALLLALRAALRSHPNLRPILFGLMAFFPFVLSSAHLYLAIVSWATWPGYVKGIEISIVDMLAIVLFFDLDKPRELMPFRIPMALYIFSTFISALSAEFSTAAFFYTWQLMRMSLVAATIYRGVCADPRTAPSILKGLAAGIVLEAALALWQRFGLGILQTPGTFVHQNLLGLVSHFVIFPFFALLMGGKRGWLPYVAVTATLIVEVLTTSRGTIVLGLFGLTMVFVLSTAAKWSPRKGMILLVGIAAAGAFAPLAASSLQKRFSDSALNLSEDGERLAYKQAAALMLSDHPWGVGANHFTLISNIGGYFNAAGEAAYKAGREGTVHNVYWLIVCETGVFGLVAFLVFQIRILSSAFLCGMRNMGEASGDLVLGLGVSFLVIAIHAWEEWNLISFDAQYPFAVDVGLLAGLTATLGYWRRST